MNGLEWIAGIGEIYAPAQWVVSRAQGVHADAQLEAQNAHLHSHVQVVVSQASRQIDEWFGVDCWHWGNACSRVSQCAVGGVEGTGGASRCANATCLQICWWWCHVL